MIFVLWSLLEGQMCTLGNFPDSVLVLSAPTPLFKAVAQPCAEDFLHYNSTTSSAQAVIKTLALLQSEQAAPRVLRCCCDLQPLCGSRTLHAREMTALCWNRIVFKGNAGVGVWELGLCFLLTPLLLIFIWSLANHLLSVFPSCKNT